MPPAMNIPNVLTVLRLALAPVILWLILRHSDQAAIAVLATSAATDFLDGVLARRWNQRTRFGAVADPLADKLTMAVVVLALATQGSLPAWLAAAVVLRDAVILAGALAYQLRIGTLDIQPSAVSKLNTALVFVLLLAAMATRAGLTPYGPWLLALETAVAMTVAISGVQYVWQWGRKAAHARRQGAGG